MKANNLNIIFFGSSDFAVEILNTLVKANFKPSCVVTQPDKKAGRHLKLIATPVKVCAQRLGLEVLYPQDLSQPDFLQKLSDISPGLFVVVAYGKILSATVLNIPRLFAINIHASLLPKYRGAAPIQWQILKGEEFSGITIIRMNEKMDEGDIIVQGEIPIELDDNAITLEQKLKLLASREILELLRLIKMNKVRFSKQDSSQASYAPKLKKSDGLINWRNDAGTIYNQIRGCMPWPVAFSYFKGKRIKIFAAKISSEFATLMRPGEVFSLKDNAIFVATAKGAIKIEELQPENSRRMRVSEFISGARIKPGDFFGGKKIWEN